MWDRQQARCHQSRREKKLTQEGRRLNVSSRQTHTCRNPGSCETNEADFDGLIKTTSRMEGRHQSVETEPARPSLGVLGTCLCSDTTSLKVTPGPEPSGSVWEEPRALNGLWLFVRQRARAA